MSPSVLAVIPARAQSKRIPGKNRKDFLGKPLIQWSIEAGLSAQCIDHVVVTTDDEKILDYSLQYPNIEFVQRPADLALDSTPGVDPILHLMACSKKKYDYLVLLQPTSPLRTSEHIDEAFTALIKSQKNQMVSVKRLTDPLGHIVYQRGEGIKFLKAAVAECPADQDLKVLNGAIYISKWQNLLEEKTFLSNNLAFFEMSESSSIDIDYPEDWDRAELYGRLKVL